MFLVPHGDPLTWTNLIILTIAVLIPSINYILFFSKIGFGLTTFYYISDIFVSYAPVMFALLAAFKFVLYLLDFWYWESTYGIVVRRISLLVFLVGFAFVILAVASIYPYGPISLFTIFVPIWLVILKWICYNRYEMRVYVSWLSTPFFFVSIVVGVGWIVWIFLHENNEWNDYNLLMDAEKSGCEPNFDDFPQCRHYNDTYDRFDDLVCFHMSLPSETRSIVYDDHCPSTCKDAYDHCLNTFIIWSGPLLVSLSLFFLSFICMFLRTSEGGEGNANEKQISKFAKIWIVLLFVIWVSASYAGAGQGLTAALFAMTLAGFIGSMVFLSTVLSEAERQKQIKGLMEKCRRKYGSYVDWMRALFIVTCAPVAVLCVYLSFFNQCVRRLGVFPGSRPVRPIRTSSSDMSVSSTNRVDWVTEEVRHQLNAVHAWDLSKVYTYAVYLGMGFMTLQVFVTKFMSLFFSWLIEVIGDMSIFPVTGIMVGVGLVLFLLPPVPGAPIYLTLGIVTIAVGRETMGLIMCIVYGVVVSLGIKLLACTLQQKLIGEVLSNSVATRRAVGVNSQIIRAMRLVLAERGLSVAKVSILVGGPDWPTSVLCGIMKLNLGPILLGTLPVILLILPTTLSGSFMYMAPLVDEETGLPEFPWAGTTAAVTLALAAIVQFSSFVFACYYLEQVTRNRVDEIEDMPMDEEVEEAEHKAELASKAYSEATQWHLVPFWAKSILSLSLAFMISSCYLVQLFQNECFMEYELTHTIEEHLDGDWKNIILPLGYVVLILFVSSCILLFIFVKWAQVKANVILARNASSAPPPETDLWM